MNKLKLNDHRCSHCCTLVNVSTTEAAGHSGHHDDDSCSERRRSRALRQDHSSSLLSAFSSGSVMNVAQSSMPLLVIPAHSEGQLSPAALCGSTELRRRRRKRLSKHLFITHSHPLVSQRSRVCQKYIKCCRRPSQPTDRTKLLKHVSAIIIYY